VLEDCHDLASCANIFRGIWGDYVDSFSVFLRVQTSIYTEFI